jgi:hypothetical protein
MNTEMFTESQEIINNLQNILHNNIFAHPSYNPQYIPTRDELMATESFDNFMQNGGYRNNIVKGIREENNINSLTEESELFSDDQSEMYGGRRDKPSPADEFHQEAVDYLKDSLKLSPLEARAYKAIAYSHIKNKNPELSGLERAKLMLSVVKSEDFLDKYKNELDKTMKIIEERDAEREKKMSESPEKPQEPEDSEKSKKSKKPKSRRTSRKSSRKSSRK